MGCALDVDVDEGRKRAPSLAWARPTITVVAPPPVGGLARCLVRRGDELHAFVGTVVRIFGERDVLHSSQCTATGVEIALLGARTRRLVLSRPELVACDAAGPHRWDDWQVVSARQRRGEPADVVKRRRTSPASTHAGDAPSAEDCSFLGSPRSRADSTSLSDLQHESGRGESAARPPSPSRASRGGADGL